MASQQQIDACVAAVDAMQEKDTKYGPSLLFERCRKLAMVVANEVTFSAKTQFELDTYHANEASYIYDEALKVLLQKYAKRWLTSATMSVMMNEHAQKELAKQAGVS